MISHDATQVATEHLQVHAGEADAAGTLAALLCDLALLVLAVGSLKELGGKVGETEEGVEGVVVGHCVLGCLLASAVAMRVKVVDGGKSSARSAGASFILAGTERDRNPGKASKSEAEVGRDGHGIARSCAPNFLESSVHAPRRRRG